MKELRTLTEVTGEFPISKPKHAEAYESCHCITSLLLSYLQEIPEGLVDVHTSDGLLAETPATVAGKLTCVAAAMGFGNSPIAML